MTPTYSYLYDNPSYPNSIGRVWDESAYLNGNFVAATYFGSYDAMGRPTIVDQWGAYGFRTTYTYDLIGDMTSYTNAAGVTFSQSFNAAGRPTQITSSLVDSQHPATLVSGAHYNGAAGITSYVLGNNLTETAAYDGLVQPCRMNVNSSGTPLGSCTDSVPSGNLLDLTAGFNYGTGDNGNVMSWVAAGQQTFSRSYTYDAVNRLYTMSAPGSTCSGLSWSYDQWGNRTAQTVTGGTCGSSQLGYNSYNHITNSGFQYDAAGNMTHDASHGYTYDAENRVIKVDGGSTATYAYNAAGNRVQKTAGGNVTIYLYDLAGHVLSEYGNCQTCWNTGYIYLNGGLAAEYTGGTTYFVHADHLGSTRLLTNVSGGVLDSMDYLPFGEQIAGSTTTTHKFTGYERDAESGLDNAQARYNSSSLGRFMSPDPIGNFVADATNPQTWNMYTYVNNNPLTFVDPTGMYCETSDEFDLSGINDADVCVVFGGVWTDGAHSDNNGNFVGGYDGEVFCGTNGGCLVWNAGSQEWDPFGSDTSGPGDPGNGAGPGGANGGCQLSDPMCAILYQTNLTRLNAIQAVQQQANRCGQYRVLCNAGGMAGAGTNAAIAVTAPATIISAGILTAPAVGVTGRAGAAYVETHPGQVVDFMRGFFAGNNNIPPPSDAGMAGWAARNVVNNIVNSSH